MIAVDWRTPVAPHPGITLGYGWANANMLQAAEAHGLRQAADATIALHVMTPLGFVPEPRKRNVLLTMWEAEEIPERLRPYIDSADLLLVPSTYCARVFRRYVDCPIVVVPLGYDPSVYAPVKRRWDPRRETFHWLLVGAANARKGWDVIEQTWARNFERYQREMLLMCKMSASPADRERMEAQAVKNGFAAVQGHDHVLVYGNMVLDLRHLSDRQLAQTYANAHGVVYPTAGEGFGLTLVEAMATAAPCVATRYSGLLDFTDPSCVRYVDYRMHEDTKAQLPSGEVIDAPPSAWVDPDELANEMAWVMRHYSRALRMGKQAARKVRPLTWGNAGRRLVDVLTRWDAGEAIASAA